MERKGCEKVDSFLMEVYIKDKKEKVLQRGKPMVEFRKANWSDLEQVLDLIEKGFSVQQNSVNYQEGKVHRVLFSYLYSRPSWRPDHLWLAEEDNQIIAAVGVFPQELSFEGVRIPVWAVSPVVTHPDHRGKRAAVGCMEQMFYDLKNSGVPAVFLWGIPNYYPKFGFVPVLARYQTRITRKQVRRFEVATGRFREVVPEDLPVLAKLYTSFNRKYWLQPFRTESWWMERGNEWDIEDGDIKEVPFPKKENFKVWENLKGEITGYLYMQPDHVRQRIYLPESVASDLVTAKQMVGQLMEALPDEVTLVIRGTPEHYMNMAAFELGGTHVCPTPLAGMIKVLDWASFLTVLESVLERRLCGFGTFSGVLKYSMDGQTIRFEIEAGKVRIQLTGPEFISGALNVKLSRLILGIYNDEDWQYLSGDAAAFIGPVLFPRKYPFIWDVNYLY